MNHRFDIPEFLELTANLKPFFCLISQETVVLVGREHATITLIKIMIAHYQRGYDVFTNLKTYWARSDGIHLH